MTLTLEASGEDLVEDALSLLSSCPQLHFWEAVLGWRSGCYFLGNKES